MRAAGVGWLAWLLCLEAGLATPPILRLRRERGLLDQLASLNDEIGALERRRGQGVLQDLMQPVEPQLERAAEPPVQLFEPQLDRTVEPPVELLEPQLERMVEPPVELLEPQLERTVEPPVELLEPVMSQLEAGEAPKASPSPVLNAMASPSPAPDPLGSALTLIPSPGPDLLGGLAPDPHLIEFGKCVKELPPIEGQAALSKAISGDVLGALAELQLPDFTIEAAGAGFFDKFATPLLSVLMDGIKKDLKGLAGVPNPFDFRAALSEVQEAGPTGSLADMVDEEVTAIMKTVDGATKQLHEITTSIVEGMRSQHANDVVGCAIEHMLSPILPKLEPVLEKATKQGLDTLTGVYKALRMPAQEGSIGESVNLKVGEPSPALAALEKHATGVESSFTSLRSKLLADLSQIVGSIEELERDSKPEPAAQPAQPTAELIGQIVSTKTKAHWMRDSQGRWTNAELLPSPVSSPAPMPLPAASPAPQPLTYTEALKLAAASPAPEPPTYTEALRLAAASPAAQPPAPQPLSQAQTPQQPASMPSPADQVTTNTTSTTTTTTTTTGKATTTTDALSSTADTSSATEVSAGSIPDISAGAPTMPDDALPPTALAAAAQPPTYTEALKLPAASPAAQPPTYTEALKLPAASPAPQPPTYTEALKLPAASPAPQPPTYTEALKLAAASPAAQPPTYTEALKLPAASPAAQPPTYTEALKLAAASPAAQPPTYTEALKLAAASPAPQREPEPQPEQPAQPEPAEPESAKAKPDASQAQTPQQQAPMPSPASSPGLMGAGDDDLLMTFLGPIIQGSAQAVTNLALGKDRRLMVSRVIRSVVADTCSVVTETLGRNVNVEEPREGMELFCAFDAKGKVPKVKDLLKAGSVVQINIVFDELFKHVFMPLMSQVIALVEVVLGDVVTLVDSICGAIPAVVTGIICGVVGIVVGFFVEMVVPGLVESVAISLYEAAREYTVAQAAHWVEAISSNEGEAQGLTLVDEGVEWVSDMSAQLQPIMNIVLPIFDQALKGALPEVSKAVNNCEQQLALVHTLLARKFGCETEVNAAVLTGGKPSPAASPAASPTPGLERVTVDATATAMAMLAPPLWASRSRGPPSGHIL